MFDDELPPGEWDHALVSLLSKVESPDKPGDLRKIAVHSHVAKVFGRIILGRLQHCSMPDGPHQHATSGVSLLRIFGLLTGLLSWPGNGENPLLQYALISPKLLMTFVAISWL